MLKIICTRNIPDGKVILIGAMRWRGYAKEKKNDNAGKIIIQAERNKIGKFSIGETCGNFGRIIVGNTF